MPSNSSRNSERKYNVVIYGIDENPADTNRKARLANDLQSALSVTKSLVPSISQWSIRDCVRLGKYSLSRSRPTLVKLTCAHDASSILANRYKLKDKPGISVKPDMTCEERAVESIRLRECYTLASSGTNKSNIKIRGSSLYINKIKHGSVINSKYVPSSNSPAKSIFSLNYCSWFSKFTRPSNSSLGQFQLWISFLPMTSFFKCW